MNFIISNRETIFGRSPKFNALIEYEGREFKFLLTKKPITVKNKLNVQLFTEPNRYTIDEQGAMKGLRDYIVTHNI